MFSRSLFLLSLCTPVIFGNQFTVEQVLSAPYPTSMTASPADNQFAWVQNDRGVYNIWTAQAPDFKARPLTSYTEDDGAAITIVGFDYQGKKLVYRKNGQRNAAHNPEGPTGNQIYWIALDGGKPHKIAKSSRAAVSPVSNELAYVEGKTIMTVALEEDAKPVKEVTVSGNLGAPQWSPDGRNLVFRNNRESNQYFYSFIVLYNRDAKKVSYVDPAVYQDGRPRWSPDGTRIAFLRRLGGPQTFTTTALEFPVPDPVELRVHHVQTGETAVAWRSGPWEASWLLDFGWMDNEHLVYKSEKTGWMHLYAVSHKGGEPKAITQGSFEVETMLAHPQTGRVYYCANAHDINRRDIWWADVKGKTQRLAPNAPIAWSPTPSPDGKWTAWLGSGPRQPPQAFVGGSKEKDGRKLAAETLPKDFPTDLLVEPQAVTFQSEDNWTIHGQLFLPPQKFKGKRPAIMYFHGGPVRQMLTGWHNRGYYSKCYAFNQYLASKGYVVLSVNFRLGIGYGQKFRDVKDGDPRGGSEYQDVLAGAKFLRNMDRVDANRIGTWGGSYGGKLTGMALARNSDLFAAGVDLHGVHDWSQWDRWVRGRPQRDSQIAWNSSAVSDLDRWRSPVLLVHGDNDPNVPFSETLWLVKALQKRKVECEYLIFPDEGHGFLLHQNWLKTFNTAADFLDRKLGD